MFVSKSFLKILLSFLFFVFLLSACVQVPRSFEPWKPPRRSFMWHLSTQSPKRRDLAENVAPASLLYFAARTARTNPQAPVIETEERTENMSYTVKEVIIWRDCRSIPYPLIKLSARIRALI